ncbi:hypothetical protein, partial [Methylophilus sp. UBA6697]|uniref:hypothetical protein n=1 Tax=Methylophilus sp. UBA6697 TaxID=1946902 RepID=UPI0025D4C2CE
RVLTSFNIKNRLLIQPVFLYLLPGILLLALVTRHSGHYAHLNFFRVAITAKEPRFPFLQAIQFGLEC